jgi:hypothetical protein
MRKFPIISGNSRLGFSILIFSGLVMFLLVACKKDHVVTLPSITTSAIDHLTNSTANCGGYLKSDGGGEIKALGVCWGTTSNPSIDLSTKTSESIETGEFSSSITNLTPVTTYYVRAYATNSAGTAYGNEISFTTQALLPTLTTAAIADIINTSAKCGGNITNDGGAPVTAYGVCWGKTANPSIELCAKTADGSGTGSFTSLMQGLSENTKYYLRAYAYNSAGVAYGNEISFTTDHGLIAYYPFNGNVNDESGNGNHGTNHGAILTTDRKGNANSAYVFDGIANYISVSNDVYLCPTSAMTLSAWVYADDLNNRHVVVDKRINFNQSPWDSYILCADVATSSQCWMCSLSTNSNQLTVKSPTTTVANTWYHLVLLYDGSKESLYVNGELKNTITKSGTISYSDMSLFIGTTALNDNFMKGKIDDIRIYDRALSILEIQALYNDK